jgi:hypothetical protein
MLSVLSRRLKAFWPELAQTVLVEVAVEKPGRRARSKPAHPRTAEVPLITVEEATDYTGPSPDAVHGEEPDEG